MQENPEVILETCFMVYSSLAYKVCKRQDLMNNLENTLNKHLKFILSQKSTLLKARICQLLGYYLDILFKNNSDSFLLVVDLLFNSLSETGFERVVAVQSLDSLMCLLDN